MTLPKSATALVQPSRQQRRDIIGILQDVYDVKKQRYQKAETDQTVAEVLNIKRWAWVTQIREEFFGPDGNEADEIAVGEIQKWLEEARSDTKKLEQHLALLKTREKQAEKLLQNVQALVKARAA